MPDLFLHTLLSFYLFSNLDISSAVESGSLTNGTTRLDRAKGNMLVLLSRSEYFNRGVT